MFTKRNILLGLGLVAYTAAVAYAGYYYGVEKTTAECVSFIYELFASLGIKL